MRQPMAMGVMYLEDVPKRTELPSPETRCCHGCGLHVGADWIIAIHEDLTLWRYPFCSDCIHIGACGADGAGLPEPLRRRLADRLDQYRENWARRAEEGPPLWRGEPKGVVVRLGPMALGGAE